jgi:hypothetical protein
LRVEAAAIWSLLGGYLLLPSGLQVDVPILPPLDKSSIPAITTILLCWMRGADFPAPRMPVAVYIFGFCFVLAPVLTSFNNSYELQVAGRSIPGFYPLDGVKIAGRNLVALAPLFIGARVLCTSYGRLLLLQSWLPRP